MITVLTLLFFYMTLGIPFAALLSSNNDNRFKIVGESFFWGVFLVISLLNIMQYFSLSLSLKTFYYSMLVYACCALLVFLYLQIKNNKILLNASIFQNFTPLYLLALALISLQLYSIILQNQALPLSAWDGWYGWIAKAKIWFYHGINEPLVARTQWLITESKFTSPIFQYPDGLSLIYVFNAHYFGWNETLLNGIYPASLIAFLLAYYGNIKQLLNSTKSACLAVVLLITIPFINTHIIIAGYADIWVAFYLALCLLNIQHFLNRPSLKKLIQSIIFMSALPMFKLESWVWLLLVVFSFVLTLLSKHRRRMMLLLMGFVFIVWYMLDGFEYHFSFGELVFKPNLIKVPALGTFVLSFVNTSSAWLEALFYSNNWNLLWYSLPFVIFASIKMKSHKALVLPSLYLTFTVLFIFVLFYMTYASIFANDFTSSNRVVLHIVPVYIYFIILLVHEYSTPKKTGTLK